MALIKCHECGAQVSDMSDKCVHCGVKTKKPIPIKTSNPGLTIFLIVVGTILVLRLIPEAKKVDYRTSKERAVDACVSYIKLFLHDPESAEFIDISKNNAKDNTGDSWHVFQKVRAKNLFNAYVLSEFQCEIERNGNEYLLKYPITEVK